MEDTLKLLFRQGLRLEVQSELTCHDEGRNLKEYIELAIRIDNGLRSRCPSRQFGMVSTSASEDTEPMQIGRTYLSMEELNRRMREHLCLYCGEAGHLRFNCPTRPIQTRQARVSTLNSFASSANCFEVLVQLSTKECIVSIKALIDFGAVSNFMDETFARENWIPPILCNSPLSVAALDGRPLGGGQVQYLTEELHLHIGILNEESIHLFVVQRSAKAQSGLAKPRDSWALLIFIGDS